MKMKQNDGQKTMIPESHFRKKTAAALALIVIGAVFIVMFLRNMQVFTLIERQQEINETAIEAIIERIEANWDNADELIRSYHKGNQAVLDDIDTLLSKGLSERVSFSDRSAASGAFADLLSGLGKSFRHPVDHILFCVSRALDDLTLFLDQFEDLFILGSAILKKCQTGAFRKIFQDFEEHFISP